MKHSVVITILIILAVCVLAIVFFRPEWIEKAWLWAVGLFGTIAAFFKRFMKSFTGNKISDIETKNDDIKKQIDDLEERIKQTNQRIELEKKLYEKDIELLNQKIALKDTEIALEAERRKAIEKMHWQEYYNSLNPDEKEEIDREKENNTIDIN